MQVPRLLKRHGLTVDDIDLWEINEAFSVVSLYNMVRPSLSASLSHSVFFPSLFCIYIYVYICIYLSVSDLSVSLSLWCMCVCVLSVCVCVQARARERENYVCFFSCSISKAEG